MGRGRTRAEITPLLVDWSEGAKILGVGLNKVREIASRGELEVVDVDGLRRITFASLARYAGSRPKAVLSPLGWTENGRKAIESRLRAEREGDSDNAA
jgi:hypothetical protein